MNATSYIQHAEVETSIRATHLPSGISVRCSDERSQFQNKQTAKRRLMLKLLDMQEESRNKSEKENWSKHDALIRGNAVKKFSGPL